MDALRSPPTAAVPAAPAGAPVASSSTAERFPPRFSPPQPPVGTPEDVAAVAVALETQDASLIIEELARRAGADPELGATLVAMAEMCNEGVDEACGALSSEEDAKLAWLARQVKVRFSYPHTLAPTPTQP